MEKNDLILHDIIHKNIIKLQLDSLKSSDGFYNFSNKLQESNF